MTETSRRRMLQVDLPKAGVTDKRVLAAMARVPRERFVPREVRARAYDDAPLPIGRGQTISQPAMVGLMTQLLALKGDERLLEVGAGSGYQTAVLCELAARVHTVERLPVIADVARANLTAAGYRNFELRVADGYRGWPERSPFDAILVTAAPPELPPRLVEQLADGGRMVIPLGKGWQELTLVEKQGDGVKLTSKGLVRFVPMLRGVAAAQSGEA